jgi:hypothetical protein
MKKLLLFVHLFLAPISLIAGIQDGVVIPDAIKIYNSSNSTINIDGRQIAPSQSFTIDCTEQGLISIKSDKHTYKITYPVYNENGSPISEVYSKVELDFSTIQLLSGNLSKLFPQGLDAISIENDTHYPIAAVYVLSSMRSQARSIDPQETVSKVVSTQDNQKTGFLELTDNNRKKLTFMFPRRVYSRSGMQTTDWREITLRAQTIAWFNKGFKVTIK